MDFPSLKTDKKTLREFGLVFAGGLIVFFGLLIPWIFDKPWVWQDGGAYWPWIGAAGFAVAGLLLPTALKPLYLLWMKIGHALGWINTRIILGLVFFILFAPLALSFRLFGHDPMRRKLDDQAASYRQPSHHLPRERMEKPF
jgi:hypothetical protein